MIMRLLAAAFAAPALLAAPALAHPRLLAATPAAGAAVPATTPLTLRFSERLVAPFSGMTVTPARGPAQAVPTRVAADGKTLVGRPRAPLAPGTYTLAWHAVSTDTHRVAGSSRFTVR